MNDTAFSIPPAFTFEPTSSTISTPNLPSSGSTTSPASYAPSIMASVTDVPSTSISSQLSISDLPTFRSPGQIVSTAAYGTCASVRPTICATSNGLSSRGVAGVITVTFIAGILITCVGFMYSRQRNKGRKLAPLADDRERLHTYRKNYKKDSVMSGTTACTSHSVDYLVPSSVPDTAIAVEASKVRNSIRDHVQRYYHSGHVSLSINEGALHNVAIATGQSTSVLINHLSNPSNRQDVLRSMMAWVILSKYTGENNFGLLPFGLSGVTAAIAYASNDIAQTSLYSRWKTMTGILLSQRSEMKVKDIYRSKSFANIIGQLDAILTPFFPSGIDTIQRRKNLEMILNRASRLSLALFSHPGSFQFDFTGPCDGVAVFPALLQTIDDQCQTLTMPKVLYEKEIVPLSAREVATSP